MQRVHIRVECPTRLVRADHNSQSLSRDSVEDCVGGVIRFSLSGCDSYGYAFCVDCAGHLKNRELIASGLQVGEDVSRKVQ